MTREVSKETLKKVDKEFLKLFDEEGTETVLAYNSFVRASAHTAINQIYNDALDYDPRAASLLASRVVSFIYQWHHELTLRANEIEEG